jgi:hypothetical protein
VGSVLGLLLAGEAFVRLSVPSSRLNGALLLGLETALSASGLWLAVGSSSGRGSGRPSPTSSLSWGGPVSRQSADELALALGDPSLEAGYWLPGANRLVDPEAGSLTSRFGPRIAR